MKLPQHLAIIMDGNGRWAQAKGRPRTYGHVKGARTAREIITACVEKGIPHLTLYTFSSENWLRPTTEVTFLMHLLKRYLKREIKKLMDQNIQFRVIGDLGKLPPDAREIVDYTVAQTMNNTGMKLTFALSYGSRQEILLAVKNIAMQIKEGKLNPSDINESLFSSQLSSFPYPDPDLIIRTSGEYRLSNFLLWQAAYSEFYFTTTLWPDFNRHSLDIALDDFMKRNRRFGAVTHHEDVSH